MNKTQLAIFILRFGFVAVFLWFGLTQVTGPEGWTPLIPNWIVSVTGVSAYSIVILNGVAEVIFALALAFNFYTPVVALLLSLHLFLIALTLGYNAIAVRDVGLALSLLALSLLTWNNVFKKESIGI